PQFPALPAETVARAVPVAPLVTRRVHRAPVVAQAVAHAERSALRVRVARDSAPPNTMHSPGAYVLEVGTLIPAVLVTEVRSTLPGLVIAQVERDVYDTPSGRVVLIPRGARLIGRYESHVTQGEDALAVVWMRLEFPDGRWMALPDFVS